MKIKKISFLLQNVEGTKTPEHHEQSKTPEQKKLKDFVDTNKKKGDKINHTQKVHSKNIEYKFGSDSTKYKEKLEKKTEKEGLKPDPENKPPIYVETKELRELQLKSIDSKEIKELIEKRDRKEIIDESMTKRIDLEIQKAVKKDPSLLDKVKQEVLDENPELKQLPAEKLEEKARELLVEKRKEELIKKAEIELLDENPELKKLDPDSLRAYAEEKIVEKRKQQLDKKGEDEKTIYEKILSKNKDLQKFDEINPELTKELIAVYGKDLTNAYSKLLKDIPKEDFPKNLEEFDALVKEKYAETLKKELDGDDKADQEDGSDSKAISDDKIAEQVKKNVHSPKSVEAMASASSGGFESKGNAFEAGTMTAEKFDELINNLPEGKVKQAFENAKPLMGVNEKDKRIKEYLNNHGQNIDPAKTPWCRAFVNAFLDDMGVSTNGSLSARDGAKTIGKDVDEKDLVPGDVVVCERKGKASDGSPGGHIGIFLGMSPEGHPMILGGNQGNTVSVKEEKRNIIAFRQAMNDEEHEKIKQTINGESTGTEKKA